MNNYNIVEKGGDVRSNVFFPLFMVFFLTF